MLSKNSLKIKTYIITLCLLFGGFSCQNDSRQLEPPCTAIASDTFQVMGGQHSLINSLEKEVWLSQRFDPTAFAKANLSAKWLGWRKGPVMEPLYGQLALLRSPGCKEDGLFSQQQAFGLPFMHGFNLLKNKVKVAGEQLDKTQLEAYLDLAFSEGQSFVILQDPDGNAFVKVWQAAEQTSPLRLAPEGWNLLNLNLDKAFQVRLTGIVQQLETLQGDVFLGPLPADFKPLNYAHKEA